MGEHTAIEWTDATWNPWIGCTKISPACQNCYAERDMKRFGRDFSKITRTSDKTFNSPLKWKEPKKIFVCSWSDFFHADVYPPDRDEVINNIILKCPQHTFILLTKRPENISMLASRFPGGKYPDNIWLGVTVENQEQADKRIPLLLNSQAKLKFLSCEPLLGPLDITRYIGHNTHECKCGFHDTELDLHPQNDRMFCAECGQYCKTNRGIDWVIVGGESGPHARPMHPDWVRSLREQCKGSNTPLMFKQWGEWSPLSLFPGSIEACRDYKDFEDGVRMFKVGKKKSPG